MEQNYLCVSIPEELQKFQKIVESVQEDVETKCTKKDFGVKLLKDEFGNLSCAAYYSDIGELIKKIYYNGSSVSSIEHYRNNTLYSLEKFDTGKIIHKLIYNRSGNKTVTINYQYNRSDKIILIQKFVNEVKYSVEYGYDELMRVNSRIIKMGPKIINEQIYKYDILDRVVEYKDNNQSINVHKINPNNELISYTIIDKAGNRIVINNKFICSDYIGTIIDLNGHSTSVKDKSYVDNIMLKKPFTSEDDLDFTISNLITIHQKTSQTVLKPKVELERSTDIVNLVINNKKEASSAPIPACEVRKLKLI